MKYNTQFRRMLAMAVCLAALLAARPSGAIDVYHDNVVILLDASGSMRNTMGQSRSQKMAVAKEALNEVLSRLGESTHVGLLVFGGGTQGDWLYPLGPCEETGLREAISQIHPSGGTPLGRYMKVAADRLLEERAKQYGYGSYRLLIVTDGKAQDEQLVNAYTSEIMARGITVDVIGVDMQSNHLLATKVHSYRRADDPEALRRAIAEVFAEVSSTRTDSTEDDAFEVIAPIPFEVASEMIRALNVSGNEPIGPRTAQAPSPAPGPAVPRPFGFPRGMSFAIIFTAGVILLALISAATKGRSRRR